MKCQGGQKEQTEIVPPGAQDPAKKENLKKKKKKLIVILGIVSRRQMTRNRSTSLKAVNISKVLDTH